MASALAGEISAHRRRIGRDRPAGAFDDRTGVVAPKSRQAANAEWVARVEHGNLLRAAMFPGTAIPAPSTQAELEGKPNRASLLVAPCPGANSALITFGGNAGYLVLSEAVRRLPKTHIIAIRDPKRCFAMCGVEGLGNVYETCINNLLRLLNVLKATKIYCFGVSAGGYPALRYGLDLNVRGVLGMSAPTTLNLKDDPGATLERYPYLTALYKIRPSIGVDMASLYAATLPRPQVLLLYSPTHERDNWLANRMRGIDGVDLEQTDEKAGHRVLQQLNEHDGLAPYLLRLRAMRPVEGRARALVG